MVKRRLAIERKSTKSKFTMTLGTTSDLSKSNLTKVGTGMVDENQYNRIKKTLFYQPEEADGIDFYLNIHPSGYIGYKGYDIGFDIPQVSIN